MTKRIIPSCSLPYSLPDMTPLPRPMTATALVRTVLDEQKTRPFWFRLRSITFGYVAYVFDVRTTVEKYDGKGSIKGDRAQGGASGIFTPVEGVLLYTPTGFGGRGSRKETRKSGKRGEKPSPKPKAEANPKRRRSARSRKRNSRNERRSGTSSQRHFGFRPPKVNDIQKSRYVKLSRSVRCGHSHAGRIAPGFGERRDHRQATASHRILFAGSPRKLAESPPANSSRRGRTARRARR